MSFSHFVAEPTQFSGKIKQCIYPETEKLASLIDKTRTCRQLGQIHGFIIRHALEADPALNFKLQRSYSSLGHVNNSVALFNRTRNPSVYFYSSIIHGLAMNGLPEDALCLYLRMLSENVEPNAFTISSILKVCTLEAGKAIHSHALKFGFEANDYVRTTLVDVYARGGDVGSACRIFDSMNVGGKGVAIATTVLMAGYAENGDVDETRALFDKMEESERDVVSWNVMVGGYAQNGRPNEALLLFREMMKSRMKPNEATMVAALSACGQMGALESGKWIHSYLGSSTAVYANVRVATALIDMYLKSGSLEDAERVFNLLKVKDVVAYNTMIGGYSLHGKAKDALKLFKEMCSTGKLHPTDITFIAILSACAHSGLIAEGRGVFNSMEGEFGVRPKVEHYGCMVNLLGRAGELYEAYELAMNMEIDSDPVLWCSLLDSCRLHKNTPLAEKVTEILVDRGFASDGTFVLLSNIYAASGDWEGVARARGMMKQRGVEKEPGCSSIELKGRVHEFVAGGASHSRSREVYVMLEEMKGWLRDHGHVPETGAALRGDGEDEKERALEVHSERLALALGLLSTEPGSSIRIIKNLRVCGDCHGVFKLMSRITGRRIVMRDRVRFHHFADGMCSCGDYW